MPTRRLLLTFLALAILAALVVVTPSVRTTAQVMTGPMDGAEGEVVVRLALTERLRGLDPHLVADVSSALQCGMVYESLYEYDPFERPVRIKPCLASEIPTVSEDGLIWTIKVRDDVRFHDDPCFPEGKGRLLTAHDVAWSIKRMAAHPFAQAFWTLEGKIKGLDEFHQLYQSEDAKNEGADMERIAQTVNAIVETEVEGIKVLDDRTLQLHLTEPYPQLIYMLCMTATAVMPKEASNTYGQRMGYRPVGTGPFMLTSREIKGRPVVLHWKRSPTYREITFPEPRADIHTGEWSIDMDVFKPWVGKRLPLADRVEFWLLESDDARARFLAGELDVDSVLSREDPAITEQHKLSSDLDALDIALERNTSHVIEYITFNMDDAELGTKGGEKAKAIRTAFARSLDRAEFVKHIHPNRSLVASSFVTPCCPGYDSKFSHPNWTHDPAGARSLLQDAGFTVTSDGDDWIATDPASGTQASVTILLRGMPDTSSRMKEALEKAGKSVGIAVDAQPNEFPEFLKRQYSGTGQAYNSGWVTDYPDAQNVLMLFLSTEARSNGLNSARFRNESYDKAYKLLVSNPAVTADDLKHRTTAANEMQKLLADEAAVIPLFYLGKTTLRHTWSLPVAPNDFNYSLTKYMATDTAARTKWLEATAARKQPTEDKPVGK